MEMWNTPEVWQLVPTLRTACGIKRPDISGDSQLIECKAPIPCTTLSAVSGTGGFMLRLMRTDVIVLFEPVDGAAPA